MFIKSGTMNINEIKPMNLVSFVKQLKNPNFIMPQESTIFFQV
jgi:hypothetical protein